MIYCRTHINDTWATYTHRAHTHTHTPHAAHSHVTPVRAHTHICTQPRTARTHTTYADAESRDIMRRVRMQALDSQSPWTKIIFDLLNSEFSKQLRSPEAQIPYIFRDLKKIWLARFYLDCECERQGRLCLHISTVYSCTSLLHEYRENGSNSPCRLLPPFSR